MSLQPPKCFICDREHWASEECPKEPLHPVMPERVSDEPPDMLAEGAEGYIRKVKAYDICPECGTNLTSRDKERARRKAYMREYRKK